jgi:hypothetical protein
MYVNPMQGFLERKTVALVTDFNSGVYNLFGEWIGSMIRDSSEASRENFFPGKRIISKEMMERIPIH